MSYASPFHDWADLPALQHQIERLRTEWIFAYGSLIWDPGFEYSERHRVTIHGYHRAFCIRSVQYRGTVEAPGIVLGLDRGGSCQGVVFRLLTHQAEAVVEQIYRREMTNRAYDPRLVGARLADGRAVQALTFIARRQAPSYVRVDEAEVLRRLRECHGARGPNCDYAINTLQALKDWGISDSRLGKLISKLDPGDDACNGDGDRRVNQGSGGAG